MTTTLCDFVEHVLEKVIHAAGEEPAGWTTPIESRVMLPSDVFKVRILLSGCRVLDDGTDVAWYVVGHLDPLECANERYVEGCCMNAYWSLMSYTECGCRFKEHRITDEGVETIVDWCERHRPKQIDDYYM